MNRQLLRHRVLCLVALLFPLSVNAQSLNSSTVAKPVPNGNVMANSAVERMEQQIRELSGKLVEMQKQLEALKNGQHGSVPVEPLLATPDPVEIVAPSVAQQDHSYVSIPTALPSSDLPSAQQTQATSPSRSEDTLPGRGSTDKGLYQGLAAGAPDQRYGRSVFGDMVKIGGYGSFRFESNNVDQGPRIGDLPRLQKSFNSFDFRRFVLTLDAAPAKRLRLYTEIEFERLNEIEIERNAIPENRGRLSRDRQGTRFIQEIEGQNGGEIAMEQAWAQYDFSEKLGARIGVILPPVGRFNILHDDDYWDLPRRPLVDRGGPVLPVKSAWRELGAGFVGNLPLGRGYLDYQFYVVNGAQLDFTLENVVALRQGRNLLEVEPEVAFASGAFDGTDTANAFTWRLAASPRLGHELAVSGYHGEYTPDFLNRNAWVNTLAFDGKTTIRNLEIEGEYVYTDFGPMRAVVDDLAHQFVDVGAATSAGETADLETEIEAEFAGPLTNQRHGFWVDFKYRLWPKWLDHTFLGRDFENPQLIPIFRFERIWFNGLVKGFEFSGGNISELDTEDLSQQRTSLGLAYRPLTSVVFTAAWEHNRRISGSELIFPRPTGLDPFTDRSFDTFIFGAAFGF